MSAAHLAACPAVTMAAAEVNFKADNAHMPSSEDPALADTVTACRIMIDTLRENFTHDYPALTERLIQSFASLASEAFLRERQAVRLLTEDQRRQHDADRTVWPDHGCVQRPAPSWRRSWRMRCSASSATIVTPAVRRTSEEVPSPAFLGSITVTR
jgi:hypothetical protein